MIMCGCNYQTDPCCVRNISQINKQIFVTSTQTTKMVSAWLMDDDTQTDQRQEHHKSPPEFIDLDRLAKRTGVLYWKVWIMQHVFLMR